MREYGFSLIRILPYVYRIYDSALICKNTSQWKKAFSNILSSVCHNEGDKNRKKIDTIRKDAIFLKQNSLCNNIMRKTKTYLKRTNFCVHIFSRISWTLVISQNEIHAKFFLNGIRKNKFKPNIHKMHISRK